MSFCPPSYVSAATGSCQGCTSRRPPRVSHAMIASRTTPTLCVFVMPIGPSRNPPSVIQVVPVISPFPLYAYQLAKTGSRLSFPRGKTTVTPVRTGPWPTTSRPSPSISVVKPTSTPATSVIASSRPAVPPMGSARSRSRGRETDCAAAPAATIARKNGRAAIRVTASPGKGPTTMRSGRSAWHERSEVPDRAGKYGVRLPPANRTDESQIQIERPAHSIAGTGEHRNRRWISRSIDRRISEEFELPAQVPRHGHTERRGPQRGARRAVRPLRADTSVRDVEIQRDAADVVAGYRGEADIRRACPRALGQRSRRELDRRQEREIAENGVRIEKPPLYAEADVTEARGLSRTGEHHGSDQIELNVCREPDLRDRRREVRPLAGTGAVAFHTRLDLDVSRRDGVCVRCDGRPLGLHGARIGSGRILCKQRSGDEHRQDATGNRTTKHGVHEQATEESGGSPENREAQR